MSELIDPAAVAHAEASTTPFAGLLADAAARTLSETSSPQMMSGLVEARLLEALIVVGGARRVLEIGTFTGVGTLAMAEALSPDGRIVTLERDEANAALAREHFAASGVSDRIELVVGDAREVLADLDGPFDLVYVDAWKTDYPVYYDLVLPKLSERGIIVADNLFRAGMVLDSTDQDPGTVGMREFTRRVAEDERVHNALLTVGDGVMLVWRPGADEGGRAGR